MSKKRNAESMSEKTLKKSRKSAEDTCEPDKSLLLHSKRSKVLDFIAAAASVVFKNLGRGYSESVYRDAMIIELQKKPTNDSDATEMHILIDREVVLPVKYIERFVGFTRCDLVVTINDSKPEVTAQKFVVELKAISSDLNAAHVHQALIYARQIDANGGILINFDQRDKCLQKVLAERSTDIKESYSLTVIGTLSECKIETFQFERI